MAEFKQSFPTDGIGRQEEEVRDLFNLLTKKETAEPTAASVPPQEPVAATTAPVPAATEDVARADENPAVQVPDEAVIEEAPVAVEEPSTEAESTTEDEPAPAQEPAESPAAPVHAYERRSVIADDFDEDDLGLELPPLVLTQAYEDDEVDEADDFGHYGHFILPDDGAEDGYEVDAAPTVRRNPLRAFWHALRGNVPLPCDSKREIVRKSVFWLSILLLTGALTYILYNVWWLPAFTKDLYGDVAQDYHPEAVGTVESGAYPQQMQLSFQMLYDRNPETRGWLSFHAAGNRDFLNIEYPIMYSGDNDKYLTVDFNGNKNKNGALFFDMRAKLNSPEDKNTSLIVYGHNMASGQMLAGLNKFIGNVNNARVAPTLTMNTLFTNGQYKVFAVVITDESAEQKHYFNVRRTRFGDDGDFLGYIENLRARSLFDYPVDVQAGDELLLLSTCTVPSSAKIGNGRLTVVARKVRAGESTIVNTSAIVKNDDVIMPYAWYTLQKKQPHAYYSGGVIIAPNSSTTTTWTVAWDDTTMEGGSTTLPSFEEMSTTLTDNSSTSGSATSTTVAPVAGTSPTGSTAATTTTATAAETTATTESTTATTESTTTESTTTESTTESTTTTTTVEEDTSSTTE